MNRLQFESIEEKLIYEKLTAGRPGTVAGINDPQAGEPGNQTDNINSTNLNVLTAKINEYTSTLSQTREITSYRYLHSDRKVLGRLIVFIKRVIRKLTFWYIEPVCRQQTTFNNAVTPSISCLTEINNELIKNVRRLSEEQEQLKNLQQTQNENEQKLREMTVLIDSRLAELGRRQELLEDIRRTGDEMAAQKQAELERKYEILEAVQLKGNDRLIQIQDKTDKLDELLPDIFSEKPKTVWDIGSFAQSGEDMIISFLLNAFGIAPAEISYLDLGANHAKTISNTYHFYKQGARGVLVEANPALIPELKFYRSGDVILNRCVSEHSNEAVDFYIMGKNYGDGDGLSTPDKASASEFMKKNPNLKIHDIVSVETISVNDIIANYMGKAPTILNIDIEGNEIQILKTVDFSVYRPLVVVIEMIPYTMPYTVMDRNREILDFMEGNNYTEYAFTGINSVFLDRVQLEERGLSGE